MYPIFVFDIPNGISLHLFTQTCCAIVTVLSLHGETRKFWNRPYVTSQYTIWVATVTSQWVVNLVTRVILERSTCINRAHWLPAVSLSRTTELFGLAPCETQTVLWQANTTDRLLLIYRISDSILVTYVSIVDSPQAALADFTSLTPEFLQRRISVMPNFCSPITCCLAPRARRARAGWPSKPASMLSG